MDEFEAYKPPQKVYKLSSNVPENITASFQNLLNNKRMSDNYKVRNNKGLSECFTILKFVIIFIIFITTCKIITLFFNVKERVEKQYNKSSHETVTYCFYSLFTFALIVQFIEFYAIMFDHLCLTFVFTVLEFAIIGLVILDNYHSKDEHYLIFLWVVGMLIFIIHLIILYKMKFRRKKQLKKPSINEKEMNSESSDQLFVEQDTCSYRTYLKQKESNYNQAQFNQSLMFDQAGHPLAKPELVKFIDEEEEHEKRNQEMSELLRKCKMKILDLEISQSHNQMILDKQKELLEREKEALRKTNSCDENCTGKNCSSTNCSKSGVNTNENSNQTSEFNSPKLSNGNEEDSSSCSETCREVSQIILDNMDKDLDYKYNLQT